MSELETNIYPITNLAELKSNYRTYRVINLHRDQEEFYQNCQKLTRYLSFKLRSPAAVLERNGEAVVVVKQDAPELPNEVVLVRAQVLFEPLQDDLVLDYTKRNPENDAIAVRFLQFLIQAPLHDNFGLWQPESGRPYFERQPYQTRDQLSLFRGYSVRPVVTRGIVGLCVDIHSKLVYRRPLPALLDRQDFQRWKGAHVIYHFGLRWYEIILAEFSALKVGQYKFPVDGRDVTLYDHLLKECDKPLPKEVAELPKDSSTVIYFDNRDETRGAAAVLCYLVAGTDDFRAQKEFPSLSIPPHARHRVIQDFVEKHLRRLRFGNMELKLDTHPLATTPKLFPVPDLEFGCNTVLSTRGTPGAVHCTIDELGRKRMSLLRDKNVGFYIGSPFDNFYFFMPQSVHETFGPVFLRSLCATVDELFPQATQFGPHLIVYPDRGKTFNEMTEEIFDSATAECSRGGYAIVMIPEHRKRRPREEDTSAAFIIQQLRERSDIFSSVIHTTLGNYVYKATSNADGRTVYKPDAASEGRLSGYLRNVAINKIALLNQKWPFVLASPLRADAVVGIDVKGNMAGFVGVSKRGNLIVPFHKKSQQKEKLMVKQCREYFYYIVQRLAQQSEQSIRSIVVHRDGRLYETEIKGIHLALADLKGARLVAPDAEVTFLEIPKTAPAVLRLFDRSIAGNGTSHVENPQAGNYYLLSDAEGFVCTTGRAFAHRGTTKPLHVVKRGGPLPIEQCLEDIFSLSCLAWTRPEDCSRDPISIKLNDRWLGEDGAEIVEEDETDERVDGVHTE